MNMEKINNPKKNCWEIKKCGREKGGAKTGEFGVCPAATRKSANGINGGKNGGRICWAIPHTYCEGQIQGEVEQKRVNCVGCEVYETIEREEGANFYLASL